MIFRKSKSSNHPLQAEKLFLVLSTHLFEGILHQRFVGTRNDSGTAMDDAVRDPVLGTVANVFVLFNDTFRNLPAGACLYDPVNYLYSYQYYLKWHWNWMSLEVTYAIRELRPGDTEVREIVANSCCQHLVSGKLRLVVNAFSIVSQWPLKAMPLLPRNRQFEEPHQICWVFLWHGRMYRNWISLLYNVRFGSTWGGYHFCLFVESTAGPFFLFPKSKPLYQGM